MLKKLKFLIALCKKFKDPINKALILFKSFQEIKTCDYKKWF